MDIGRQLLLKDVWIKIVKYCAYSERCTSEVSQKLYLLGCTDNEVYQMLADLRDEKYVDDVRYAKAFASGKYRLKKWGRHKIRHHLKSKELSNTIIEDALAELPSEDYEDTLETLLRKKIDSLKDLDEYILKNKAAKYAIGKGFEPEKVWQLINAIF